MYHHVKELMYTVHIGQPDPRFGNMLLEQFGGANGELAAAMQYSIQGLNCDDPERKDLLMDIGTEELSQLDKLAVFSVSRAPCHQQADGVARQTSRLGGGVGFKIRGLSNGHRTATSSGTRIRANREFQCPMN